MLLGVRGQALQAAALQQCTSAEYIYCKVWTRLAGKMKGRAMKSMRSFELLALLRCKRGTFFAKGCGDWQKQCGWSGGGDWFDHFASRDKAGLNDSAYALACKQVTSPQSCRMLDTRWRRDVVVYADVVCHPLITSKTLAELRWGASGI